VARRSWFESWGADPAERHAAYPCDRLVAEPDLVLFRAVTVHAPPPIVFRWLCQLRVAPYSYDWLDNGGRRSPRHLQPGLEQLTVGQRFLSVFALADFEPDRHVTLHADHRRFGEVAITYRVTEDREGSRLVAKLRVRSRPTRAGAVLSRLLPLGDLIMMRKQLRTLAALAERGALAAEPA
jgi:hypothetical protein